MKKSPRGTAALALWLALAAAGGVLAAPYADGELVQITGTVTDADGRPLADAQVLLEVSRVGLSFRQLGRVTSDRRRVAAELDEGGSFKIEWRWDDYFNRHELLVAVPPAPGGQEDLEVLERVDLAGRLKGGAPVVVPVVVGDSERLATARAFAAGLDGDDQRRIVAEMGKPDRIRRGEYGGHEEVSWWYFQAGRVYRFRDGELLETTSFEPVRPF